MWRVIFQQIYLIKDCIQRLARLHDLFKMASGRASRSGFFESLSLEVRDEKNAGVGVFSRGGGLGDDLTPG
jgi:hypothetical protein